MHCMLMTKQASEDMPTCEGEQDEQDDCASTAGGQPAALAIATPQYQRR